MLCSIQALLYPRKCQIWRPSQWLLSILPCRYSTKHFWLVFSLASTLSDTAIICQRTNVSKIVFLNPTRTLQKWMGRKFLPRNRVYRWVHPRVGKLHLITWMKSFPPSILFSSVQDQQEREFGGWIMIWCGCTCSLGLYLWISRGNR